MKKSFILIAAAFAAFALTTVSCNKDNSTPVVMNPDEGAIAVTIGGEASTKAVAIAVEKQLSELTFFVFDKSGGSADGRLDIVKQATAAEIETFNTNDYSGNWTIEKVKVGKKTVVAVANFPYARIASIKTLNDLKLIAVDLGDNSRTATAGKFVMYGETEVTVTAGTAATPSITLNRLVARVILHEFENKLPAIYGSVTVKSVYLANVVGNQNLGGTAVPAADKWLNKLGCKGSSYTAATVIGNGDVTAEVPEMTFRASNAACALNATAQPDASVYGFKNMSSTAPNKLSEGFNEGGAKSMFYVIVTIDGTDYWYPIELNGLEANYDYSVKLTVIGLGNRPDDSEFGKKISKENAIVSITVSDWANGTPVSEII